MLPDREPEKIVSNMTYGTVETIVARCLVDTDFVEAVGTDAATALRSYEFGTGLLKDLKKLEIDKVRRFAGFIGMVQHNYLWESFYGTRQLLRLYGIELDVFVAYRKRQLSLAENLSRADRTRFFLDFLETDFLNAQGVVSRCPCLIEVLHHERTIWELDQRVVGTKTGTEPAGKVGWRELKRLIPRVNGVVCVNLYSFNPASLIELIRKGEFRGRMPRTKKQFLGYWKELDNSRLRLLELDDFFVYVLQKIDHRRSVQAVVAAARRETLREVRPVAFREFFDKASKLGLIRLCRKGE